MARQRKYLRPRLATLFAIFVSFPTWAAAPDIVLPDPFAVELPEGMASVGAGDGLLTRLLAGAKAGGDRVTVTLPRDRVGPGAWRVILSAWAEGVRDRPVARREAALMVLPHGMTPVGSSGVGSPPGIARDADGFVHMVWTDAWRPGSHESAMYRRGRELPDGTVQLDTDVQDLANTHRGDWSSVPSVVTAGKTIHFAWPAGGTIWYRALAKAGDDWRWTDEIDTKAAASGQEPAIAADADADTVHMLTPDGHYLSSRDAGRTWSTETVAFGGNGRLNAVSLTLDHNGRPLAAADVVAGQLTPAAGAPNTAVRCVTRIVRRVGTGAWQVLPGPLDGRTEWVPPERPDEDVTCNAIRVREDQDGAMHATWSGASNDQAALGAKAYYAWRPADGDWHPPVPLVGPDPLHGLGKSFASGIILDRTAAMPLMSFELHSGWRYRGGDAAMALLRGGISRGPVLTIAGFTRDAMTANEPALAMSASSPSPLPSLFHSADGHVWADVLMILSSANAPGPGVIVWWHRDVTDWAWSAGR